MEHEQESPAAGYRDGYRTGFVDAWERAQAKKPEGESAREDEGKDEGTGDGDRADQGKGDASPADKQPLYKRPVAVALTLAVILSLVIAGIIFWRHSRKHEATDDAFVDGYTSQLAAQTAGRVLKLYVTDNQHVNAGDPLLDIDSRDNDARAAQARSQVATARGQVEQAKAQIEVARANAQQAEAAARQAEADWRRTTDDLSRYRRVNPDAVPQQQVDAAVTGERSAKAKLDAARMSARSAHAQEAAAIASTVAAQSQVEAAVAGADAAALQQSYTHVVAPISGRIAKRAVDVGNVIGVGQALLALVSDSLWVTANYKETQLTYMRRGQPVEIAVDAFPGMVLHGQIDSVQPATGAYFSSLPAENATGNYVKVVQRVPVKITFSDDEYKKYAVGPGMSVTPDVTVR